MNDNDTMFAALSNRADWITARELTTRTGLGDRVLRAIANESNGKIISGQRGYKLTRIADPDEVLHAANWLRHQANEMTRRANAIYDEFHAATIRNNSPELPLGL